MLKKSLNYLNNMLEEEKVRVRSKRKYTCKRNKGEHEYLKPVFVFEPSYNYIYNDDGHGQLHSSKLTNDPKYKYVRTEVKVFLECVCKHCGHKALAYLTDKLK